MLFIDLKLDTSDTSRLVILQITVKILPSGELNYNKRVHAISTSRNLNTRI